MPSALLTVQHERTLVNRLRSPFESQLSGCLIGARFRVENKIGSGSTSVVYRGSDIVEGGDVALKIVPTTTAINRARLLREIAALQEAPHTAAPNLLGAFNAEGRCTIATELLEGVPISPGTGWRDVHRTARLIRRVAEAIDELHRCSVIHRDLKPEHILVAEPNGMRLLDFGSAWTPQWGRLGAAVPALEALGTVGYASPEQGHGHPASAAADVYSIAVIAAELATGRSPRPSPGESAHHARVAWRGAVEMDLRRLGWPPAVLSKLWSALATDPLERPQTAASLASAFSAIGRR